MQHLRIMIIASAALLVLGACTTPGTSAGDGVATLSDEAPAGVDSPVQDSLTPEEAVDAYNKCVTDEGLPELAMTGSPGEGGSVVLNSSTPGDGSQKLEGDPSDPEAGTFDEETFDFDKYDEVNQKCGQYLQAAFGDFELSPEQEAAVKDAELALNKCMKEQGIDMPELATPGLGTSNGSLDPEDPGASSSDGSMIGVAEEDFERFEEAFEACSHVFDEIDKKFAAEREGE